MIHIENYNQTVTQGAIDKSQYSFKLDVSGKRGTRKKLVTDRQREIRQGINHFLLAMKSSNALKVSPLERNEFDGLKHGEAFEYEQVSVLGFPYRIGIISYRVVNTEFVKMGIKMVKQC
jgi:hypothetical protein